MELHQNQQTQSPSPKKSKEGKKPSTREDGYRSLHKKTLSSISLKSLSGRDTDKATRPKDKEAKSNKQKKSTNLSNLLSRPKSSKNLRKEAAEQEAQELKDKENQNPNGPSHHATSSRPPPIYAQFSTTGLADQPSGAKVLEDEINLYTPHEYSRRKQRDFSGGPGPTPTLSRHDAKVQRPKSTYLPSSFSLQDIRGRIGGNSPRNSSELTRKISGTKKFGFDRNIGTVSSDPNKAGENRSLRTIGAKSKISEVEPTAPLDDKDVDREFEAMLDRRNIPEHQRGKMRSLTMSMKRDFIRQDCAETAAAKNDRPGTNSSDSSADATSSPLGLPEVKPKRPRSLTFTLSRGTSKDTSPTKKLKPQANMELHSRANSSESTTGRGKSFAASSAAAAQALVAKAKGQLTDDFVSYLRKVQKPESVEVGRLHKLRILLRNETVAWTEGFIEQGGMKEIVGLLHRTMEVEWRYVFTLSQLCFSLLTNTQRGA